MSCRHPALLRRTGRRSQTDKTADLTIQGGDQVNIPGIELIAQNRLGISLMLAQFPGINLVPQMIYVLALDLACNRDGQGSLLTRVVFRRCGFSSADRSVHWPETKPFVAVYQN